MKTPPLIVHIIYRLGVGGLENGLINIINNMPEQRYRHAIIALKASTDFQQRLTRSNVACYVIDKKDGQDWRSFIALYRLLTQLKPAIVHTRNLATLEYQVPTFFAGIKHRVHGEHGWDVFDPDGTNKKYQWLRRLIKPLIQCYIPLSQQLERYLIASIKVDPQKITRITNGVDTAIFYPQIGEKPPLHQCPFRVNSTDIIIGTVGRMHGVKDQLTLVNAFILVCQQQPLLPIKLYLIGDGPLKAAAIALLEQHQLMARAWLAGERADIADIMRQLDVFILPSQAEGISNTILEAMATGLPVIATDVGGNAELVVNGMTGQLIPARDPQALANCIIDYVQQPQKMREHGNNARQRALSTFSQTVMVARYQAVYDSLLTQD